MAIANWISLSQSAGTSGTTTVTITASTYQELLSRSTSLYVRTTNSNLSKTVNIVQEPREVITVTTSPSSITAPSSGGSYTFNIISNGSWTISYPNDWLVLSSTSGTGNETITVTVPSNSGTTEISGNIVVSTADNSSTVSVTQGVTSFITVSPSTIQDIVSSSTAYTLAVASNTNWVVTSCPNWITISPSGGTGNHSVTALISANTGGARSGNVIFSTTDSAATATVSLSQNEKDVPVGSTEYFTLECVGNTGRELYWFTKYTSSALTIEYRINSGSWNTVTSSTGSGTSITTLAEGDVVEFRGDNLSYVANGFKTTSLVKAYGNILSLINSSEFSKVYDLPSNNTFGGFLGSLTTALTDASDVVLQATGLTTGCYSHMFENCARMTGAPALPATNLATGCYAGMFMNCMFLSTAPELPAMVLATECYSQMFDSCSSLRTAPVLPAPVLVGWCYDGMFNGCSVLNNIKCLATDISASNCTRNWTTSVRSSGIFIKAAEMTSWSRGTSGIPNNWTVQDA